MVRSGGWWSLKVVAVVLVAAGVAVEGDGDVNGGVGGWSVLMVAVWGAWGVSWWSRVLMTVMYVESGGWLLFGRNNPPEVGMGGCPDPVMAAGET
ncbi:hypothetical protein Tco_0796968 [Tanacetum coccineum]